MPTTPNHGIWTPSSSEVYAITEDLAATAALNVPNGSVGTSRVIDFPPGYFTQPPVLSVTKAVSSGARHVPYYSEVTTSDVRIGLYDPSGATSSVNATLSILAVQSGGTGNGTTYP